MSFRRRDLVQGQRLASPPLNSHPMRVKPCWQDRLTSKEPLAEMQKIVEAENSDLFDVLAYVAFSVAPETRSQRADMARLETHQHFTDRQQIFLDFVLAQYVRQGVDELDADKLTPLLRLKYNNAISDAVADLGSPEQIRNVFVGFQRFLYESRIN